MHEILRMNKSIPILLPFSEAYLGWLKWERKEILTDNPDILLHSVQEKVEGVFWLGYFSQGWKVFFIKQLDDWAREIELPYLAGPRNFEVLGSGYARDYAFVYHEWRILQWVNPETFESLSVIDPENNITSIHIPSWIFADWDGWKVIVNGEVLRWVSLHRFWYCAGLWAWSDGVVAVKGSGIVYRLDRTARWIFDRREKYYGLPSKRALKGIEKKYVQECRREMNTISIQT